MTRSGDDKLRAIALTTLDWATGRTVTWVEGDHVQMWTRPQRESRRCRITVEHVMASASLPLLFPAVALDGSWHGDGGVRLAFPLAPAIHLGADRILAISTRHAPAGGRRSPDTVGYPPPAQFAGILLNSIFLDQLDQDAMRLERINQLLPAASQEARRDLRPVRIHIVRPSLRPPSPRRREAIDVLDGVQQLDPLLHRPLEGLAPRDQAGAAGALVDHRGAHRLARSPPGGTRRPS
jgi:predicted acylesterase/phospholipase RssA